MNPDAANIALARIRQHKPCRCCGRDFVGLKIARYCSESCRQKAKYQRGKGENTHRAPSATLRLGLSRPYDWSNSELPDDVLMLRVLEGADIGDIVKCVRCFGASRMRAALKRMQDPLALSISRRKLENCIAVIEVPDAQA